MRTSDHALVCPFCRAKSGRVTEEGYSNEPGLREPEARYMGLWRTREIGVCDCCGERWELRRRSVPPRPTTRTGRLGDAVTMTAILGMFAFFGIIGLFWLALGVAALVIAPILLLPLGLTALVVVLFYFASSPKAAKGPVQDFSWLSDPLPDHDRPSNTP